MPSIVDVRPGELTLEEFAPMQLSQSRLARETGMPAQRLIASHP